MATKLNARGVAQLKAKDRRFDVWDTVVPGLGLRITPNGTKTWCLRYRIGRNLRRWTIGAYPDPFMSGEVRPGLVTIGYWSNPAANTIR